MKKLLLLITLTIVFVISANAEKIDYKHPVEYNKICFLAFKDSESANVMLCTNQNNVHFISVNLKPILWDRVKNQLKDNGDLNIILENGDTITLSYATRINAFKEKTGQKKAGFYNGHIYYVDEHFKPYSLIYPLTNEEYETIKKVIDDYTTEKGTGVGAVKAKFKNIDE